MTASVIFISLLISFIHVFNANAEQIAIGSFSVGMCVEVDYTAPPTGRASINLIDAAGDVVLHVDYRVSWGSTVDQDTVVLNTRTSGSWGTEQRVKGIKSTPGTVLQFVVCAKDSDFSIDMNQKELATYAYRTDTKASRLEFESYDYDSTIKQMCVVYSA